VHDMGAILDMDPENEEDMDVLRDLQSGLDDLACARELLEREEQVSEAEALVCTSSEAAPEPPAGDQPESEIIEPPKKRTCLRFHKEQIAVPQREFDRGTSRLSDKEIASEIDSKHEKIGRKIVHEDVKRWMHAKSNCCAKTTKARSFQLQR
jgi:hypothetical protein